MTLTAPAHLRGKMHCGTHPRDKRLRLEWIAQHVEAGVKQVEIAEALGISTSTLCHIMTKAGIRRRAAGIKSDRLSRLGLRTGTMAGLFNGLPVEVREALVDEAIRSRVSLPDVISRCVTDAMEGRFPGTGGGKSGSAGGCGRNERDGGSVSQKMGSL